MRHFSSHRDASIEAPCRAAPAVRDVPPVLYAFWIFSALGWLVVFLAALRRRPLFARFAAVLVGLHTLVACALARHLGPLLPAYAALQVAVYAHYFALSRPRMRSL